MARTTIRTEDITASAVTSAKIAAGAVDTSGLEDDIALLGFKVASNGSLAKYNLVDQTVDSFETEAGIDLSTSTGEYYNSTSKYYSGHTPGEYQYWQTILALNIPSAGSVVTDMYLYTGSYTEVTRNDASGITTGMMSYSGLGSGGYAWNAANGLDNNHSTNFFGLDGDSAGDYNRINFGASNKKALTKWSYWLSGGDHYATWNIQRSSDGTNWTTVSSNWAPRTGDAANEVTFDPTTTGNMTLVSNATTAESAPSKGDIVLTWTDGVGTATLGTDITAEFSADNGSTWTAATLVDKGTTGSHNIASAHDITRTSTSGTSMRWRVKTLNQSGSKITRIQAVSLGWS